MDGFSESFQAKLRKSIPPDTVNKKSLVKLFEIDVSTNNGIKNMDGYHEWVFKIPQYIKDSPLFLQCLEELKNAIEITGVTYDCSYNNFKNNFNAHYSMKPGTYTIIRQLMCLCNSNCELNGCEIYYQATICKDPSATAVIICM